MRSLLGISLGTRCIGIVVLSNGELVKWRIRTFEGKWSYAKMQRIIKYMLAYAKEYRVPVIACKIPDVFPTTIPYNQLVGAFNLKAKEAGITLVYYTLSELKGRMLGPDAAKRTMHEQIMLQYPRLLPLFRSKKVPNNPYYGRLFDAISAAHFHFYRKNRS